MESTEVGGDLVASLQDLLDRSDRLLGAASDGVQEGRDWCAELALQGEALQVGKKFPSFQALVESSKVLAKEQIECQAPHPPETKLRSPTGR